MKSKLLLLFTSLALVAPSLPAWNIFEWPEAADKNSVTLDTLFAGISFSDGPQIFRPVFSMDYVIPIVLPFSIGAYFATPDPNLKSFGTRLGFHVNLNVPKLDLYALYVFDFGWIRNPKLREYGDEEQEIHWYDFRIGIRYTFNVIGLFIETGFKLQSINAGISLQLN
jgi:hypothetical protein